MGGPHCLLCHPWYRRPPPLPVPVVLWPSIQVDLKAQVQPITRSILKVELTITPDFEFNPEIHGSGYVHGLLARCLSVCPCVPGARCVESAS